MFTYQHTDIRVRYADTDQMGYVYYGNYARFYEIARVEALRSMGLTYKEVEDSGTIMPVFDNYSRYWQPARYDDLLTVKVIIRDFPLVKAIFEYEITNQNGTLVNTGKTTLVFLNAQSQRPVRAPQIFVEKLRPFFE